MWRLIRSVSGAERGRKSYHSNIDKTGDSRRRRQEAAGRHEAAGRRQETAGSV